MVDIEAADLEKLSKALNQLNNKEFSVVEQTLLDVAARSPLKYDYEYVAEGTRYIKFWDLLEFMAYLGNRGDDLHESIVWLESIYPRACYYLGYIYVHAGNFVAAIHWLEKGKVMEPHPKILSALGAAYTRVGDHERALACYQEAINATTYISENDRALALRGMGFQLIELNRLEEAKKSFQRSLELEPDNALAKNELNYIAMLERGDDVSLIQKIVYVENQRIDVSTLWFYGLLQTQTPNGWFTLTEKLAENVGRSLEDLRNIAALIEGVKKESTREIVLATATAILVLQVKAAEYKKQWSEKVKKANKILNKDAKNARLNGKPVVERAQEIFFPKNISGLH